MQRVSTTTRAIEIRVQLVTRVYIAANADKVNALIRPSSRQAVEHARITKILREMITAELVVQLQTSRLTPLYPILTII